MVSRGGGGSYRGGKRTLKRGKNWNPGQNHNKQHGKVKVYTQKEIKEYENKMYQKRSVKLSAAQFKKLAQKAFERDGYRCQVCKMGIGDQLAPHHIIPKGRLRLDILENILTVCVCHRLLHDGLLKVSVDDLIDKYNMRGYLK